AGGLFGNTANTNTGGGLFGNTGGTANTGGGLFGNTAQPQQNNQAGGLFGNNSLVPNNNPSSVLPNNNLNQIQNSNYQNTLQQQNQLLQILNLPDKISQMIAEERARQMPVNSNQNGTSGNTANYETAVDAPPRPLGLVTPKTPPKIANLWKHAQPEPIAPNGMVERHRVVSGHYSSAASSVSGTSRGRYGRDYLGSIDNLISRSPSLSPKSQIGEDR
ncbi:unnamed protein product, partial [Amoebophrya sp. A120]